MKEFKLNISQSNEDTILEFAGRMDERMTLPELSKLKKDTVIVDFGEVQFINSLGVRTWLVWTRELSQKQLVFRRISPPIIRQSSTVKGFIPFGTQLESFYVPMGCDDCGAEINQLVEQQKAKGFADGLIKDLSIKCEACEGEMTPDLQLDSLIKVAS